ncbi:MAG: YihY/virulence factor BrkB family protein [Candidatus Acidiferrales bacterium]
MTNVLQNLWRAGRRVYPASQTVTEAVAFCMFLAFFPILLLGLGILHGTTWGSAAVLQMWFRVQIILPPESARLIGAYLGRHEASAFEWIAVGLFGTLLVGIRLMNALIEGFHRVSRDIKLPSFGSRLWRSVVLLCLTIFPWLTVVMLTILGAETRRWMVDTGRLSKTMEAVLVGCYLGFVFTLGVVVLMAVYRIGRPGHHGWREVLPGSVVATLLWWAVDLIFGTYVRHMPYDVVYGGVAAAIGLLVWMYLTTTVIFFGEAYNVESFEQKRRKAGAGGEVIRRRTVHGNE